MWQVASVILTYEFQYENLRFGTQKWLHYAIFIVPHSTHLSVSFVFSEVAVELAPVPPREDDVRRAAQHLEHLPREAGGEGVAEQLVGLFE